MLSVDHKIQITLFNPAHQVALLVKNVYHQARLCTKRVTHSLMIGGLGSIRMLQLQKELPLIGLVSFVTDYSVYDLLSQKILTPSSAIIPVNCVNSGSEMPI